MSILDTAKVARRSHILWIIRNRPEAEITGLGAIRLVPETDGDAYQQARELWMQHLSGERCSMALLSNAIDFFSACDPRLAVTLLERAVSLESRNIGWRRRLAVLRSSCGYKRAAGEADTGSSEAFTSLESVFLSETDAIERLFLLPRLGRAAIDANAIDKAKGYGNLLLETIGVPNFVFEGDGYFLHHAELVLGRVALREGRLAEARARLLAAGRVQPSPILSSFGPDMVLGKELLNLGERAVVVEFLGLCSQFWDTPNHQAEHWIDVLEHGGMPDFGENLESPL
jgi:hypothetical protein